MRLLLDTHVLLWWRDASPSLSSRVRAALSDAGNDILVSAATLWEIVVKRAVGKLRFPDDLEEVLEEEGFELLPIGFSHLHVLGQLPFLHRDPFDRMLIAQAIAEGIPLLTRDRAMRPYPVPVFW
jgi:PIN domain nuclease of toxin-antitoxin system